MNRKRTTHFKRFCLESGTRSTVLNNPSRVQNKSDDIKKTRSVIHQVLVPK